MATCGSGLIKMILMILNFIILALGIAVLVVAYKLIDSQYVKEALKLSDIDLTQISWIILVVGIVLVLIAAFGFFGSCLESACLLRTYGLLLFILIVIEIYVVYKSISTNSNIEDELEKGVKNAIENMEKQNDTAKILQIVQKGLKCCGWNGPQDYRGQLLASCCNKWDEKEPPMKTCSPTDSDLIQEGCKQKLQIDTIQRYLGGSTGLGIVLVLIEIILILAACCLAADRN